MIPSPLPAHRLAAILVSVLLASTVAAQAVHDECATALPLVDGLTQGDNVGATPSVPGASCFPNSADVWYRYVPTFTGGLVVSLLAEGAGADFNTMLSARLGNCGQSTEIACSALDEYVCHSLGCFYAAELLLNVVAGEPVYIVVGGLTGASGQFVLSAQSYALTPNAIDVPGDFTDLAQAIQAAPPGGRVVVHGGVHGPQTIDRPLTLVGDPAPELRGCLDSCPNCVPGAITLDGPGSGEVVLSNVRTAGAISGAWNYCGKGAISGGGFDELHVYDSCILAPYWISLDGQAYSVHAIDTTVSYVQIVRSTVRASNSGHAYCGSSPEGHPGIEAPGTVVVLDSTVLGGSAIPNCGDPTCGNVGSWGYGGDGIVAVNLIESGSHIAGGRGGTYLASPGVGATEWTFCQSKPNGAPYTVASHDVLPLDLSSSGPLVFDTAFQLDWTTPSPLNVLFGAVGSTVPAPLPAGQYNFLAGGPLISFGLVLGGNGSKTLQVGSDPDLLGAEVAFQVYDPQLGLTRPVLVNLLERAPDVELLDSLGDVLTQIDDDFDLVPFAPGFEFPFFGTAYTGVYVNTNGNLTFGAGDHTFDPAIPSGVVDGSPRISIAFHDLVTGLEVLGNPCVARGLFVRAEDDRFTARWHIARSFDFELNTMQVTLLEDGTIQLSYEGMGSDGSGSGYNNGAIKDFLDVSVAVSPGGTPPLQVADFSSAFTTPIVGAPGTALFENFDATSLFDLDLAVLTFTPNGAGGYDVTLGPLAPDVMPVTEAPAPCSTLADPNVPVETLEALASVKGRGRSR